MTVTRAAAGSATNHNDPGRADLAQQDPSYNQATRGRATCYGTTCRPDTPAGTASTCPARTTDTRGVEASLSSPRCRTPAPTRTCQLHKQHSAERPPAAAQWNPRKPSRPGGGQDDREPTTPQLQPPLDRKQTTLTPANTKPVRCARVETGTASKGLVTPWCAAPR